MSSQHEQRNERESLGRWIGTRFWTDLGRTDLTPAKVSIFYQSLNRLWHKTNTCGRDADHHHHYPRYCDLDRTNLLGAGNHNPQGQPVRVSRLEREETPPCIQIIHLASPPSLSGRRTEKRSSATYSHSPECLTQSRT